MLLLTTSVPSQEARTQPPYRRVVGLAHNEGKRLVVPGHFDNVAELTVPPELTTKGLEACLGLVLDASPTAYRNCHLGSAALLGIGWKESQDRMRGIVHTGKEAEFDAKPGTLGVIGVRAARLASGFLCHSAVSLGGGLWVQIDNEMGDMSVNTMAAERDYYRDMYPLAQLYTPDISR